MKKEFPVKLNKYRIVKGKLASDDSFEFNGMFLIPFGRKVLAVMVSDESGWDHVSVSCKDRTPTWKEMCFVKDQFFDEDEVAIQYHPAKENYVNIHNFVLHIWKPHNIDVPLPPICMV